MRRVAERTRQREEEILKGVEEKLAPNYDIRLCPAGHDVDHIQRMCRIADILWEKFQEITGIKEGVEELQASLFLLKLAIWFHNSDRSRGFENLGINREEVLIRSALNEINYPEIDREEVDLIVEAVKNHSTREQTGDGALLRLLRYCDMLDVGALGIARIFALRGSERKPLYIKEDLLSSSPRAKKSKDLASGLEDIYWVREWEKLLPEQIRHTDFVRKRFCFMETFLKNFLDELKELGATPQSYRL